MLSCISCMFTPHVYCVSMGTQILSSAYRIFGFNISFFLCSFNFIQINNPVYAFQWLCDTTLILKFISGRLSLLNLFTRHCAISTSLKSVIKVGLHGMIGIKTGRPALHLNLVTARNHFYKSYGDFEKSKYWFIIMNRMDIV